MMRSTSLRSALIAGLVFAGANTALAQDNSAADVGAALKSQVNMCWRGVDDLSNPAGLTVQVEATLRADGTFEREPTLAEPFEISSDDRDMKVAARRGISAFKKCAPYRLPANDLEWPKRVILTFCSNLPSDTEVRPLF